MLIKITDCCKLGCSHCLGDCNENGAHMDLGTFEDTIKFINKRYVGALIISGGEPTDNPSFVKFMTILSEQLNPGSAPVVCVTTNGFWLAEDEDNLRTAQYLVEKFKNARGINLSWQISTDRRFYPKRIDPNHKMFKDESFIFCDDCVEKLVPLGRAKNLKFPPEAWRMGSSCFNVRAVARQIENCSFNDVIAHLAGRGKFCTPNINIHGDICVSESQLCKSTGTNIYSSDDEIIKSIIDFKCEKCGVNKSLPKMYRDILGIE